MREPVKNQIRGILAGTEVTGKKGLQGNRTIFRLRQAYGGDFATQMS